MYTWYTAMAARSEKHVDRRRAELVLRRRQLGTGHAMQQAALILPTMKTLLMLRGDVPLISSIRSRACWRPLRCGRHRPAGIIKLTIRGLWPHRARAGDVVGIVEQQGRQRSAASDQ